jgi:CheY-like chemotaxis protein
VPAFGGSRDLRHILIVDDDPQIRTLLSVTLRNAVYKVTIASDAFEAMTLCQSMTFDAVITDVEMPGMNGHELVRWITANYPQRAVRADVGVQPGVRHMPAQDAVFAAAQAILSEGGVKDSQAPAASLTIGRWFAASCASPLSWSRPKVETLARCARIQ